jgi:hypothetical protein
VPKPNFFNDNLYRSYPFVFRTIGLPEVGKNAQILHLPNETIVDAGFLIGPSTEYDPEQQHVFLKSVTRSGQTLNFEFKLSGSSAASLIFEFNPSSQQKTIFKELNQSGSCGNLLWSGYVTFGDLQTLISMLNDGFSFSQSGTAQGKIEPTLVQSLYNAGVTSINVANSDRTRVKTRPDCGELTYSFTLKKQYVQATCLKGNVKIAAGINCDGLQTTSNEIRITPTDPSQSVVNTTPTLFPGESPPIGSTNNLLDGSHYCNEVVRTFAGGSGPFLRLRGSRAVTITDNPAAHKITIKIEPEKLGSCEQDNEQQ